MSFPDNDENEIQIDEELNEIEYYELVSIEDIMKINPDFIAFSRDEIYNEIFNFVKNKSKTSIFLKLFYEIINKKPNVNNFIILSDATRGDYENLDIADFINSIKKYNKLNNTQLSITSKNKLWFPLSYNLDDTKLRFKAEQKTVIELSENNNFIVFKDDETNIPILGVYYYTPVTILDDYLNLKVMSHLYKNEKLDDLNSDKYETFDDLIKDYKIKLPIDKIDKDDYNYTSINNILLKYNYNFDNININDLNEIKKYLNQLNKNEKVEKVIYNKFNIKEVKINYNRNNFFKALKEINKLIDITINSIATITKTLKELEVQKKSLNYKELEITKDLYTIINNINDKNYNEIIDNLRQLRIKINLDNAIEKLTIYSNINKKEILNELEELESRFDLISFVFKDIYKINFDFANEAHEIEIGTDEKNYQGIPLKIVNYNEKEDKIEYNDDIIIKNDNDENKFDKYFNNQIYNNEKGFIELLKLIFPFISKMEFKSGLSINYDILTNLLFNKFRIFESKTTIIKKYIPDIIETDLELILSTPLKQILIKQKKDRDNKIYNAINEYFNNFINVIYEIIAFWSLNIQREIIYNTLIINFEMMSVECEYLWDNYGSPYDLTAKKGVLTYLLCIFQSVYNELFTDENYDIIKIDKNDYEKRIINIISNDYSKELKDITKVKINEDKKINLGRVHYDNLYKLLSKKDYSNPNFLKYYVEALIYMPSIKFQKIHKYLNGCCLEKIDENFSADLYFKNERQDLKKAKEKLSHNRVFNAPRYKRFFIRKEKKREIIKKFIKIQNPITTEIYMNNIQEWIKNLNNNETVFTKELISNLLKSNVKTVENYKELYLNYFKNKDLKLLLTKYDFDNYKQISITISKILYKYLNKSSLNFIKIINNTIEELDKLNSIITDDNINEIINIRRIAVIRIISLPSYPENAINKNLIPSIEIDSDIYKELFKEIINEVIKVINSSKMLNLEEQINFINKIREENKANLLSRLNKKSLEEKNIEKELKKYGLSYEDDEDEEKKVNNEKPDDKQIEIDGENEYEVEKEDDEIDDEYMERSEYGFIYS